MAVIIIMRRVISNRVSCFYGRQEEDVGRVSWSWEAALKEGGSWVEYAWRRTASSPLKTKGAWISRVTAKNGDDLYVGVGFAVLPPVQAPSDGLYGFVVNGDGKIVAHGGSRA